MFSSADLYFFDTVETFYNCLYRVVGDLSLLRLCSLLAQTTSFLQERVALTFQRQAIARGKNALTRTS